MQNKLREKSYNDKYKKTIIELVKKAKEEIKSGKSSPAFEELCKKMGGVKRVRALPPVRNFIEIMWQQGIAYWDPEDIAQEFCAQILLKIEQSIPESFTTWCFNWLRSVIYNRLQKINKVVKMSKVSSDKKNTKRLIKYVSLDKLNDDNLEESQKDKLFFKWNIFDVIDIERIEFPDEKIANFRKAKQADFLNILNSFCQSHPKLSYAREILDCIYFKGLDSTETYKYLRSEGVISENTKLESFQSNHRQINFKFKAFLYKKMGEEEGENLLYLMKILVNYFNTPENKKISI